MDAGYGNDTSLRDSLTELGLPYVAGIQSSLTVWRPGEQPLPPKEWSGRGRPPIRNRRDDAHKPISVKALALSLPAEAWQAVAWREGSNDTLSSRFARLRIRPAHRDTGLSQPRAEEWLLIEWPEGEAEPAKYWLGGTASHGACRPSRGAEPKAGGFGVGTLNLHPERRADHAAMEAVISPICLPVGLKSGYHGTRLLILSRFPRRTAPHFA